MSATGQVLVALATAVFILGGTWLMWWVLFAPLYRDRCACRWCHPFLRRRVPD